MIGFDIKLYNTVILLLIICSVRLSAEITLGKVRFVRKDVFDTTRDSWLFAAKLANALHCLTREYVIRDELLFSEGQYFDEAIMEETERNLRATGLFTKVKIELDSVGDDIYNVYVITQDKWSTRPAILLGTGGNSDYYGGRIEELNLAGTGTNLSLEALYKNIFNIGIQGHGVLQQNRLLRSDLAFDLDIQSNKFRTDELLSLQVPYRTLAQKYSYGVNIINSFGSDFFQMGNNNYSLIPLHQKDVTAWYSMAWRNIDRVFFTTLVDYNDVNRGDTIYRRAYDNTGKILFAFSSVAQNYIKTNMLNTYLDEDIAIGGWGTAVLGKIFPIGHQGEGLYYIGAQGEISRMFGDLYLFGQVSGASSFANSQALYTYQDCMGLGFLRLSKTFLIAEKIRQQSVWNWDPIRQLIIDNNFGLRGYNINMIPPGENRMVSNFEFRFFPNIPFWIINFGATAFWDAGTVWNKGTDFAKTQWHHSIGIGLRFYDMKSTGKDGIYRLDFAFNLDEKKLGEIIFTTDQFFSVFQSHTYKLPEIYGLEFDSE